MAPADDHEVDLLATVALDGRLQVVPVVDARAVDADDLVAGLEAGLVRGAAGDDAFDRGARAVVDAALAGDHHEEQHEGDDQVDGDAGEDGREALPGRPCRKVRGSSAGSTSSRLVIPMMRT